MIVLPLSSLLLALAASNIEIKAAAERSIALIQKVNAQWKNPCFSCHNQTQGDQALAAARNHGLAVNEKLASASSTRTYKRLTDLDGSIRIDELIDPSMSEGSMLMGAYAAGAKPTLATASYARHIADNQFPDGHWTVFDTRPPQSSSDITGTAVAIRAVSLYLPAAQRQPYIDRARHWLAAVKPADTEEATYRLLGLHWTQAPHAVLQSAARHLAELQHSDGSWAQTPSSTETDAYATAEALYALATTKSWPSTSKSFQLGIDWLIKHQAADGSWHVKSRINTKAPISPPYFESGFPYGHDQFISCAATALAVQALAEALPLVPNPAMPPPIPGFDDSKLAWVNTALFGTPAELAKIDPNSATPGGTTALMMAANDAAKIEILLKRGANPKAITREGIDALMIAALFNGNSKSLDLLLKAGADPSPKHKVRFDAHALAHAVMTNDAAMVQFLISKGADPNRPMRLLGGSPMALLNMAAGYGNPETIRHLVKAGAKVDAPDDLGMTALSYAALGFRPAAIQTLLQLGANPKHKDSFGLIPYDHTKAVAQIPGESAEILKARH